MIQTALHPQCHSSRTITHTFHSRHCWIENCTAEVRSQQKIINKCWLGLLSTFVLHGKLQIFFCVPRNQYRDLWWGTSHWAEGKRAVSTNWVWNENEKAPVPDRWKDKTILQFSPTKLDVCSEKASEDIPAVGDKAPRLLPVLQLTMKKNLSNTQLHSCYILRQKTCLIGLYNKTTYNLSSVRCEKIKYSKVH